MVSTIPSRPESQISFAFAYKMLLTRWLPTVHMRLVFCTASTIAWPSATLWDMGFSQ